MTTPGQPPTYPTTSDFALLQRAQDFLLEPRSAVAPITIASTMWSVQTLVDMLNYKCKRFLRETGLVVARLGYDGIGSDHSIALTPGLESVTLPQNLVDPLRLAFVNYDTSVNRNVVSVQDVPREDFLSLDAGDQDWESTPAPQPTGYTQSITQTLEAFLAHPPSDIAAIDLTFVAFSGTLTGLGVALGIPPEFVQYPLYGMLQDAYSVEGEAYNQALSDYCGLRWSEGVMLAKCLLEAPSFQDPEAV